MISMAMLIANCNQFPEDKPSEIHPVPEFQGAKCRAAVASARP